MSQVTDAAAAHAALGAALVAAGFDQDAAEYHGALCGALCVRIPAGVDPLSLLERVAEQPPSGEALAPLLALRDATAEALAASDGGVQLVLPDDELPLGLRARALGQWCDGFLFGLASQPGLSLRRASAEVREIIEDITQFTRATFDDSDDAEIEESAYAELVEYVRVGLQLVFVELSPRQSPANDQVIH